MKEKGNLSSLQHACAEVRFIITSVCRIVLV